MAAASDDGAILAVFERLALAAGRAVMEVFHAPGVVERKADASPVTEADRESERIILAGLAAAFPAVPCVAEEQCAAGIMPQRLGEAFFLVDPLDGTKEFVARNGEFTVNIALVEHGRPVLGVVHVPVLQQTYRAHEATAECAEGGASFQRIHARTSPAEGATLIISRSHAAKELVKVEQLGERVAGTIVAGSSVKFCRIAEGAADLYPRLGPTMEWDTAAGQAILEAAGGSVRTPEGETLAYGKAGFRNPHFIARGVRHG